ncbi:TauD/TfdA family dioxygenase [Tumidithrix helvetica PCC 7403]|uniref:TauD/TfdA family dioxygenase n=1 Tax=Tumidithrix helvetica TaxID=3457545 RepID=UPI003C879D0E
MKTSSLFDSFGTLISNDDDSSITDLNSQEILDLFKLSKLLVFRGFAKDTDQFQQFTSLFCSDFITYMGGGYQRKTINPEGDKTLLSVNYYFGAQTQKTFPLPLHGEMYYLRNRPAALWFYCVVPASSQGETMVCDGSQLYDALSSSTKKLFQDRRLRYIRYYPNGEWQNRFQSDNLDEVVQFCLDNEMEVVVNSAEQTLKTEYFHSATINDLWSDRPVFINNILPVTSSEEHGITTNIVRLEDGSKIPDEVIQEIRETSDRLTKLIAWQATDIALIDNARVLHGRRAFTDTNREICLRMSKTINW